MWLSPPRCALAMRVPIPFLDSSTALWLLSCHECFVYFFRFFHRACGFEQWVRATLAQLLGSASRDVRLCVRGIVVTVSVRFCGGGIDSFLGFEYGVVITLASHVFEYFLRFLLRACVICAFWLRWGSHGVTPLLSCLLSRFPHVRSLYWVFRLLWHSSELQLRWRWSPRRLQRRFFC